MEYQPTKNKTFHVLLSNFPPIGFEEIHLPQRHRSHGRHRLIKMTYLDQILGVCIELVGTTLSICGLNGQKHSLMRAQNNEDVNNLNVGWIVSFSIYAVG